MTLVHAMPGGSVATRPAPGLPASSQGDAGHPAVRALTDLALLDPDATSSARVENLSRAHPVWSVSLPDGRRLVVKSSAPERGLDLGIEFLVYRLAVWCEPVREVLPEALVVDEDRHLLVLVDARSSAATGLGRRGGGQGVSGIPIGSLAEQAGWPELVHPGSSRGLSTQALAVASEALGRTLGALHRGTTGLPLPPARPPVIVAALTAEYPATGAVAEHVAFLRADPLLTEAAGTVSAPVAGCLVNHDMKWDNVVVSSGRTVLVDWEMAGLGDPAWDLGCLLAEHLVRQPGPALTVTSDVPAVALLRGYALGARPRPEIVPVLARRTVTAAALRIAQLGLEVVDTLGAHRPASPRQLTDRARSVLSSLDSLTEEVAPCLR
ncbi:phosphotransferase [Intrasporangium oryzae]|uniref:phosphotransferase n=1 Tax=Intrasporangium oryzae TaxID=412687 RepID=UPI0004BB7328|nr:phosphotransferase [Intrasporangium oryzae]